jgi:4-hydroxy-3-methylbut-2-enyl diphosphate reductase
VPINFTEQSYPGFEIVKLKGDWSMRVIRAENMGLCFGVRDALAIMDGVDRPAEVTVHGELVHTPIVLDQLERRGFRTSGESTRDVLVETPVVLITAHGISDVERDRLAQAGKRLIDTTCPLVERAHRAAVRLRDEGYHVLIIGRLGHVEVQGIAEDLPSVDVIGTESEVTTYPHDRLGIVCQTTTPERLVKAVRRAIETKNPHAEIRFVDTVCLPTKDHQRSLERLLDRVEAMVVVGGRNSNNTRELVALCGERGLPALHVQDASEVDPSWIAPFETVGLTAGTSTLDVTIDEVERALLAINPGVGA